MDHLTYNQGFCLESKDRYWGTTDPDEGVVTPSSCGTGFTIIVVSITNIIILLPVGMTQEWYTL